MDYIDKNGLITSFSLQLIAITLDLSWNSIKEKCGKRCEVYVEFLYHNEIYDINLANRQIGKSRQSHLSDWKTACVCQRAGQIAMATSPVNNAALAEPVFAPPGGTSNDAAWRAQCLRCLAQNNPFPRLRGKVSRSDRRGR
ncbi:hypothetical protein HMPREF9080_01680 [Cardiobacterium valvarum F0432]|uniref:Uncharacterized protein n=1 Tax=Cardiobacterium valvarum F0432 TaxID=797473 RepID=G9ZFY0_9GAMM|nr:hypothetical protein HMPREF9080_01680 [Cardiobacterium valvarum F0432]